MDPPVAPPLPSPDPKGYGRYEVVGAAPPQFIAVPNHAGARWVEHGKLRWIEDIDAVPPLNPRHGRRGSGGGAKKCGCHGHQSAAASLVPKSHTIRWGGLRWIGLPLPLRLALFFFDSDAPGFSRVYLRVGALTCPIPLLRLKDAPGCGCLWRLKLWTASWAVARQWRQHFSTDHSLPPSPLGPPLL
jgi:hypothetical protein